MDVPVVPVSASLTIKGSRFLAELLPCASQSDARACIKTQKQKYADASHVVHAFITGASAEISGMSDDGEPSGTAGRPVLDVLRGSGCTNVLLTVTRWFGGTLLGTGGLVKAYGEAAKLVLSEAVAASAFEELVEKRAFAFEADYAVYEKLKRVMEPYRVFEVSERFGTSVAVSGVIRSDEYAAFAAELRNASAGRITI